LKNAVSTYGTVCNYAGKPALSFSKKSLPGAGGKSAGTVRSRRMKFCEKGVGGGRHQQAKTAFWRSRRKAVLSICGNKDTACQVAHRCSMGYFDTLTFKMLIIKLIYEQLSKAPYRACLLKEPFGAI
jgi:hypothetical protein